VNITNCPIRKPVIAATRFWMSFLKKLDTTKKYPRPTVDAVINPQKSPDPITELSIVLSSRLIHDFIIIPPMMMAKLFS
jgi:hypothetical protein